MTQSIGATANQRMLDWINDLLHPYLIGVREEFVRRTNLVITNRHLTHYRHFGDRTWTTAKPNEVRIATLEDTGVHTTDGVLVRFLREEDIAPSNFPFAQAIVSSVKPYYLGLHGDLQGQYHYCLVQHDPMECHHEQLASYIFPGTQFDLTDSLPEKELTTQVTPFVAGSLGWLTSLPLQKTIQGIEKAKKRLG